MVVVMDRSEGFVENCEPGCSRRLISRGGMSHVDLAPPPTMFADTEYGDWWLS